jgi:predicted nuclease of restriction endonuclease-like (RecB) superfamily
MPRDLLPTGYDELVRKLKDRIREAQVHTALSVNRELVLLYWRIGREISIRMRERGRGAKVVDRLARDLKHEFPEMKGFSPRNLRYMRTFAEAYPDESMLQAAPAK